MPGTATATSSGTVVPGGDPWDEPTAEPAAAAEPPEADEGSVLAVEEQAVLGGMLMSAAAIEDVMHVLSGGDFYQPRHELIYDAIMELVGAGQPVDALIVADVLDRTGELARAGGAAYLHTLISAVPTSANAGYYAHIVTDRATKRRLVAAGVRIQELGLAAAGGDVDDLVTAAHAEVVAITDRHRRKHSGQRLGEDLDAYLDQLEQPPQDGILWPFQDLNREVNPMAAGQMIIVGARPSVGKTSFGLDVARNAAIKQKRRVLFHTLEMSRREIQDRIVAAEAKVMLTKLITHKLEEIDWGKIAHAAALLSEAQLIIDDSERLTMADLRASIRRHHPDLVIVDYLQLATVDPRAPSRREALEAYSRGIKVLAKAEEIPIMAMAQLNRESEKRANKRPYMSDLREAGAIEQDADLIMLLHREDMYDKESKRAGEADVIVAKQRNGATGDIPIGCQLHFARFCDMAF